ncbi:hypothetical protein DQ04_12671000 [Trypanosoma grayi]|uniref:hypothetical protein n=1 Tax=Trypanosoma grayi TaxID=71804 RepID=UPI0004F41CD0|nr:hypothetical protein DQ04_12671000 [Trypanosoma grayi]KEG06704.1 hypothetical protein DQ04_12671000 [Trypanosoma grayi]
MCRSVVHSTHCLVWGGLQSAFRTVFEWAIQHVIHTDGNVPVEEASQFFSTYLAHTRKNSFQQQRVGKAPQRQRSPLRPVLHSSVELLHGRRRRALVCPVRQARREHKAPGSRTPIERSNKLIVQQRELREQHKHTHTAVLRQVARDPSDIGSSEAHDEHIAIVRQVALQRVIGTQQRDRPQRPAKRHKRPPQHIRHRSTLVAADHSVGVGTAILSEVLRKHKELLLQRR